MSFNDELVGRAQQYADQHGLLLDKQLGFGVHGIVFLAASQSEVGGVAIKVHRSEEPYCRERDTYLRLKALGVKALRGCHVPQLRQYDDQLLVIDMTVVKRPFVLDFGGAYLDHSPDFSEEVLDDWRAEKQEQFGPRWPEVQAILGLLEGYGVFMIDVNPGNISFGD